MKTKKQYKLAGLLGVISLLVLTACSGTIKGTNNNQTDDPNGFFALDNAIELLPVEAMAQKLDDYMGLNQGNSQAVNMLFANAEVFGGLDGEGINRNLGYSVSRHKIGTEIMNLACSETLSMPGGYDMIFPNGGVDVSAFFSNMTGRVFSADAEQVIQDVSNISGFSSLTQDQQNQALCMAGSGGILAHIGAVY